jgi:hypothetical protein
VRGRLIAREFWHAMCRLDTRPGRKKTIRVGVNDVVQHWRHVQYCTDIEMAVLFFTSSEYSTYLLNKGTPFKEDIFYQAKCPCITKSDFEECSCPHCTVWRESVRSYHRQRASWHRELSCTTPNCACGNPEFLQASRSAGTLRTYLHRRCGKVAMPGLRITQGANSTESVDFYNAVACLSLS